MIDEQGNVKCDECGKKFGELEDGKLKIVCQRCKHYNIFHLNGGYQSHKLNSLTQSK